MTNISHQRLNCTNQEWRVYVRVKNNWSIDENLFNQAPSEILFKWTLLYSYLNDRAPLICIRRSSLEQGPLMSSTRIDRVGMTAKDFAGSFQGLSISRGVNWSSPFRRGHISDEGLTSPSPWYTALAILISINDS